MKKQYVAYITIMDALKIAGGGVRYAVNKTQYQELIRLEGQSFISDNYTAGFSKSRRLKAIGNGWTVEVIKHILSFAKF